MRARLPDHLALLALDVHRGLLGALRRIRGELPDLRPAVPQRVLRLRARRAAAVFRFLVAAAFLPAATRFVDLRAADLRAVDLRAGAVFRFRVAAAFFPAATRLVDLRAVDFLAVDLRAVVLRAAFRAGAVFRFRVAAAFFPAATRFVDFRAVDFRAVDFRTVDLLAVDFRAVALRAGAVFRFRVAAAFFPAATRLVDLRAVDFLAVDFLAVDVVAVGPRPGVRLLPVGPLPAGAEPVPLGGVGVGVAVSMGPPTPDVVLFERGTGRSQAGVSGRQDGSGASDVSRLFSSASRLGSEPPVSLSVLSLPGHSRGSRSDDGMCALPPRVGVISPLPERAGNEA
jgi:hypothetical protein